MFANLSDEDRQKARQLMQQMREASPEERQKLMDQLTKLTGGRGGPGAGAAPQDGANQAMQALTGANPEQRQQMLERFNQAMSGRGESGGRGGRGAAGEAGAGLTGGPGARGQHPGRDGPALQRLAI